MVTILLPTMAAFKDDAQTMFDLLESTAGKAGYDIGLEVMGKPEHFQNKEHISEVIENMNSVAGGAHNVVHGFSGLNVYETGMCDMGTGVGKKLLRTYLQIAKAIDAKYVHVHSAAGYRGVENKPDDKSKTLKVIRGNLLDCMNEFDGIKVGIENLPWPSMGDVFKDPVTMWCDYVDSLEDCMSVVKGTKLGVTMDTCHYALDKKGKIDLVKGAKELGNYLSFLHVSDAEGFWTPHKSIWKEGIVPGDGRIGEEQFKKFFAYIKENHPDVGINVEVFNDSFKDPKESRESMKRVLSWLN